MQGRIGLPPSAAVWASTWGMGGALSNWSLLLLLPSSLSPRSYWTGSFGLTRTVSASSVSGIRHMPQPQGHAPGCAAVPDVATLLRRRRASSLGLPFLLPLLYHCSADGNTDLCCWILPEWLQHRCLHRLQEVRTGDRDGRMTTLPPSMRQLRWWCPNPPIAIGTSFTCVPFPPLCPSSPCSCMYDPNGGYASSVSNGKRQAGGGGRGGGGMNTN